MGLDQICALEGSLYKLCMENRGYHSSVLFEKDVCLFFILLSNTFLYQLHLPGLKGRAWLGGSLWLVSISHVSIIYTENRNTQKII